jgi:NADH-quinone oxidoreductase subunit E
MANNNDSKKTAAAPVVTLTTGAARGGAEPRGAEPEGSALYEVLKGIDFERRQLVGKKQGSGLIELVEKEDGGYRCYSCTLCERTCPVDCIEIEYCPEFPEQPFDYDSARAAALATLPGESCSAASACVMGEKPAEYVPEVDMKLFDPVIAGIRSGSGLVEALHATQEAFGYLPRLALEGIAEEMHIKLSRVYGVASFYAQFRLRPVGKYVIDVCMGTACHVAGAPLVVEAFSNELEIPVGGTTPDGLFTLQTVNCVGACALAPVVRIGVDETHGRMGPSEARRLVRRLRKAEQEAAS